MATQQQIDRFVELSQALSARLARPGAEEWPDVELTMSQLRTLLFLIDRPRRMSEIAVSLGSSLSATTSMIERLESKELVVRQQDPHDWRVVMCQLTPLGRRDVERFWRLRQSRVRALARLLTPDEFEQVVAAMQIVANALSRTERPDSEQDKLEESA